MAIIQPTHPEPAPVALEIQSLDDLARWKARALQQQEQTASSPGAMIKIGTATCGIAAGAAETLAALLAEIEQKQLNGLDVVQIGCIGLCSLEPLVEVQRNGSPAVVYTRVTPERMLRILDEHVLGGSVVQEFAYEIEGELIG